jgi:hypothetical protein
MKLDMGQCQRWILRDISRHAKYIPPIALFIHQAVRYKCRRGFTLKICSIPSSVSLMPGKKYPPIVALVDPKSQESAGDRSAMALKKDR